MVQLDMVLSGAVAYGLCRLLTPVAMWLAPHIGAMDIPRDGRRLHTRPIPRAGGIAIYVAFLITLLFLGRGEERLIRFFAGSGILVLFGLLDDVWHLPPWMKLTAQLSACVLTVQPRGWWGAVVIVWMVALINAHNMIDGMDGLAASVAAIEGLFVSVALALGGNGAMASVALAVCGGALGFLHRNRHPAQVFMGDGGSQFLGFALGYLAVYINENVSGSLGWMASLFVFALPVSDLVFAAARRLLQGKSPFAADRGHWHHRLIDRGMGQRRALLWLVVLSSVLGISGLLLLRTEWYGFAPYALLWAVVVLMLMELLYGRRPNA